jgi:aspartyl-tRNA(Asn)/glutamyl-tRNA(Gln) amidotransferase subunit C
LAHIDKSTVSKLANLASLSLSDEESERFPEQLEKILSFAERLQRLDTSAVPPSSHALLEAGGSASDDLRADVPRPEDAEKISRNQLLEAAPDGDTNDGLFKVPRILPTE